MAKIRRMFLAVFGVVMIWGLLSGSLLYAGEAGRSDAVHQDEHMNLLVQQFMLSQDAQQSDRLLKEIKETEGVTVEKLENLIENGVLYPPDPAVGSLHRSVRIGGRKMGYALYVPENYDPAQAYPLIVCLHGAGFMGDSYLDRWKTRLGEKSILVCPTLQMGPWWSPLGEKLVLAVMNAVQAKYHVDPNRISLTGMSNGAIGTYLIGIFNASRFSAISPMAGGIPEEIFPFLKNLISTGIYIIHGSKDQVMPVALSRDVSNYLKKEKISYIYREHDREHPVAGGHFFPREELPALVTWFQKQLRNPYPKHVVSVRDRVHLEPFYWTEIDETIGKVADVQESILTNAEVELVRKGLFSTLTAHVENNRVEVQSNRVHRYTLFFNRHLIDFSKPVVVISNGKKRFEGMLSEDIHFLLNEAKRRKDRGAYYTAGLTIDLSETESSP
ncbi:MAG: hypothetical protein ABGX83_08130 [Nitrospira sp.]|nr:hypothetical protein [Candidatus Manganitrophaceae bacterium]